MAHPGPLVKTLPAGRHAVCRCGKTRNAPLCDGSHAGSGLSPTIVELPRESPVAWCLCRASGKLPMCDGSHKKA